MAETAKSMNFGADATLVSAAGALAKEMGPADLTDSFDKVIEARGELLDSVQKNFKLGLLAIDGANAELKETMEVLNKKLNNGDLTNTQREELQLKMDDYRAQMKAIPRGRKGKQQRDDLMYEINREIKTAKNRDEAMTDVLGTINNDLYDPAQLDANYINFLEQIAKDSAEEETGPGFSKTKNEKGETVYSYTYTDEAGEQQVIEGDIYDIQKKINGTKKDYEFIKNQNDVIFGWQDWATKHPNAKFEEVHGRIASDIETSFAQSPDKFKSMINHPMGWSKKSYVETLRDPQSDEFKNIVKVLDEMGAEEFDNDGDGSITEKDFVTEENINTMIKSLTDPSATERRTAHKAAATFYADTEAKTAFEYGVRDRAQTGSGGGDGESDGKYTTENYMVNGQQVKFTAQYKRDTREAIANREEVAGKYGMYTWTEPTDDAMGYYTGPEGEKLSPFQVANREYSTGGDRSSHKDFKQVLGAGGESVEPPSGLITRSMITGKDDDATALNLNNHFAGVKLKVDGEIINFEDRFEFKPRGGSSRLGSRDLVLYDKYNNWAYDDGEFKNEIGGWRGTETAYRFNTGPGTGWGGHGHDASTLLEKFNEAPLLKRFIEAKTQVLLDEYEEHGDINPE